MNDYQTFNYEAREKLKGIEKGVAGFTTLVSTPCVYESKARRLIPRLRFNFPTA